MKKQGRAEEENRGSQLCREEEQAVPQEE